MKALKIMRRGQELTETNNIDNPRQPEPIIIFLTDGQPNQGKDEIITNVTRLNTGKFSLFSLALGDDADLNFLKKLSLQNSGFARKIYEASDTALQLRDFYREVSSPLLANITFKYQEGEVRTLHVFSNHTPKCILKGKKICLKPGFRTLIACVPCKPANHYIAKATSMNHLRTSLYTE